MSEDSNPFTLAWFDREMRRLIRQPLPTPNPTWSGDGKGDYEYACGCHHDRTAEPLPPGTVCTGCGFFVRRIDLFAGPY